MRRGGSQDQGQVHLGYGLAFLLEKHRGCHRPPLTTIPAFLPVSGEDLGSKAQQPPFPSCRTVGPRGCVCPGSSAPAPLARADPSSARSRSESSYVTSFTQVESEACLFSGLPQRLPLPEIKTQKLMLLFPCFWKNLCHLRRGGIKEGGVPLT